MIVLNETPKAVAEWLTKHIQAQIELRGLPPHVEIQSSVALSPNLRELETKIIKCHYE